MASSERCLLKRPAFLSGMFLSALRIHLRPYRLQRRADAYPDFFAPIGFTEGGNGSLGLEKISD